MCYFPQDRNLTFFKHYSQVIRGVCEGRTWSACLHGETSTILVTYLSLQEHDIVLSEGVQLVNHVICLAPNAGLQLLLDSYKVFV